MSLLSSGYVNSPIFAEIDIAPEGHPFSDVTYSMIAGERKNVNLIIKPRKRTDWIKRGVVDMMDVEIDGEIYQVSLQELLNWLLMSKQGLSQWRFKLPDGTWANFVDNTGNNLSVPIGSTMLGTTFDYIISDKERSIKFKAMGGMYRSEYKWMNRNGATPQGGGSGGTALSGFAHTHYNTGAIGAPGIVSAVVGSDHFIKIADGSTMTLAFTPLGKKVQPRDQPILMMCEPKLSLEVLTSDLANTQDALEELFNTDTTWTIGLAPTPDDVTAGRPNQTIVLASNVFMDASPTFTETSDFSTKVEIAGATPIDSPAWAASNIVVDLTGNSITLNRIGVA